MDHTRRLIRSDAGQHKIPAVRTARSRGKPGCVKPLVAAMLAAFSLDVHALPADGAVSAGSGSIVQNGSAMTVSQASQNLAINWQSFNIGANERVNFMQPNASAIALNRVLGSDPSRILGQLNANGQVWILNPNGLLFGSSAQVNVGGLVASTLNISDADFLAGKRTFSGSGGTVANQGSITAAGGGYVALLGGQVSNEGVIAAQLGTVALAAGNQITLDFNGDKLLSVQVDQGALDALAQNRQLIRADGGTVLMTAQAADTLATAVVNNTGVIEARSIENHNGVIKLLGDMRSGTVNVAGTLDASAPSGGNGGFIETSAAHVKVADNTQVTTAAFNGLAGSWLIDPIDFTIASGSGALTTSGIGATTLSTNLGGGNIAIATNATTAGNGDIFVNSAVSWSANKLTLTAHRNININANLNGSGTASLALEYGQGAVAAGNTSNYYVSNGAKVYLPAGANFSTKLGSDGATTPWTVITSLGVEGDATVAPGVMSLQGMNTGLAGNYVLGADIAASGTATWNANAGFTAVGTSAAKFTGNFDGLGHTITGLTINRPANVAANNYQGLFGWATGALRNVGLINSNISGLSVVGTLAGRSDGAVSSTYADGGSVTGALNVIGGLIGQVGGTGSVANSYASVSVTGTSSGASSSGVGGLIGTTIVNTVSISNSYSTGSVSGATYVGGLVGQNNANIDKSYASGAVNAGGGLRGGFIGDQLGGTITNSYWDSVTTGRGRIGGTSGGFGSGGTVTSLTDVSAAPHAQASYPGLDFSVAGSWRIYEGQTRPLLKSFLTPLTVTANGGSKTYDGAAGNGVTYSALPNANLLGTLGYGIGAGAGSYTTALSGLYSNQKGYDVSYANAALTVNKANLSVSANAASKTYDGLAYGGGNGVVYSGFVNGETAAALGGALAYGGSAQGAVNAGSYAITPSGLTSSNYAITFVDGSLTVNKAPLSVTANAASKTYDGLAYGGGNGVAYSGFVNGETAAALGGTLTYTGTSQGAVNAGSYVITPSGQTSGNYTISFANGALTVNKASLTVTANAARKIYNGLAYSGGNGVSYSGFANGETAAVLGGTLAYGGSSQGAVNAGSYVITPSGLTSGNYTLAFRDGTLVISDRTLVVPGAPVNGYTGAIASMVAGATTVATGSVAVAAGGGGGGGQAVLLVDNGGTAGGMADAGLAGTNVADTGAAAASGAVSVAGAAGAGDSGQGGSSNTSSEDATAESFASEYELMTHGCGLRLPAGLGC